MHFNNPTHFCYIYWSIIQYFTFLYLFDMTKKKEPNISPKTTSRYYVYVSTINTTRNNLSHERNKGSMLYLFTIKKVLPEQTSPWLLRRLISYFFHSFKYKWLSLFANFIEIWDVFSIGVDHTMSSRIFDWPGNL